MLGSETRRPSTPSGSNRGRLASGQAVYTFLVLLATVCIGFELGILAPLLLSPKSNTAADDDTATATLGPGSLQHSAAAFTHPPTPTPPTPSPPSNDPTGLPPYVQSLDTGWQSTWLHSASPVATHRSVANAECLLYHETDETPRCALPRTNDALVTEMNVAYGVCGSAVHEAALTSVKSLILHRHSAARLHVWLIASPYDRVRQFFEETMRRWPADHQPYPVNPALHAHNASVTLHFLDMDAIMSSSSSILSRARQYLGLFRRCATLRLWLPQLLPPSAASGAGGGVVLYVDCDTLVLRDYRQMFSHAQLYSPSQFISFAYEGTSKSCGSWYHHRPPAQPRPLPYAINSGVMLLNVTRARAAQAEYSERLLALLAVGRFAYPMGDQDVYNRWIGLTQAEGKDYYFPMPFSYNWRECTFVEPGHEGGMTLMHGNAYKFHNAKDEPFWAAAYQFYHLWHKLPSNTTMAVKE